MQIAILGGTGDIGEGLALRFARDTSHHIIVGSRTEEKAEKKAAEYRDKLEPYGGNYDISGMDNLSATESGELVIMAIPPQHLRSTVESVDNSLTEDKIVVSPAVGMQRNKAGFHYNQPKIGSIAELIDSFISDDVPVVGAFQNLAAGKLSNLEKEFLADVIVTGDETEAKKTVSELAEAVTGIRSLDGGSLANSSEVESLTPLLINIAMSNDGMHNLGVKFQ
ncbi:NADPH-dependent F420 reductase [Natrialbaceae archaeon A-chndr2]